MSVSVSGLDVLLSFDGETYVMDSGYWIKMKAHKVSASEHIPHGVRYSLTLHDRNNTRVLGYDNAHAVESPTRKRFAGVKVTWDHIHRRNVIEPYEFDTAAQLLEDFWGDVEKHIEKMRG